MPAHIDCISGIIPLAYVVAMIEMALKIPKLRSFALPFTVYSLLGALSECPMYMEPAVAQVLNTRQRIRETRLICLKEWKDGI